MIVVSDALVLARAASYVPDLPIVLYDDLVTVANIAADQADANYPVTNLANPQTSSLWKSGSTADQYLTVTLDGTVETDCLSIARHNLGSGLTVASVEGKTAAVDWTEVCGEQQLGDDTPAMFVFTSDFYIGLRLKLQPASVAPQMAVLSVGPSLKLPRSVPVGHKPLKTSRSRALLNPTAMNGDFIGNVVTSQTLSTTFAVNLLDPTWWDAYGQPFADACRDPFFLAWRPDSKPTDIAYAWATNDPQPVINQITKEVDISMNLAGLGL